ncbi:hypothetical protein L596_021240 [Steinernema carpocapsae]|uniref:Uncharacterized protein n=1 Tax=Steinernema carpocapsae TaxID=34508 RepID=A0A4V6A151_STECR|nr:hypothetical protein L596_021240 [Steinernema carpocapsae]
MLDCANPFLLSSTPVLHSIILHHPFALFHPGAASSTPVLHQTGRFCSKEGLPLSVSRFVPRCRLAKGVVLVVLVAPLVVCALAHQRDGRVGFKPGELPAEGSLIQNVYFEVYFCRRRWERSYP